MNEDKPMAVMAIAGILFLISGLALTACRSPLAPGRATESPIVTPAGGPERLPSPTTDIWSVPAARPATPLPVEDEVHSPPRQISPPPVPTPLPDRGIRVAGILEREFEIRAESGAQASRRARLVSPEMEGEILVGIVERDFDVWTMVALNLFTGDEQLLFEARDPLYAPRMSGEHVTWTTSRDLYVYSMLNQTTEKLPGVGVAPRRASISGEIVVWEYLPDRLSADWDIRGYDLSSRRSFPIVSRPGGQFGPLISDRWVLYLDSADAQAADWDDGLYAVNLETGETIRLGQVNGRWPYEALRFYAIDAPWAVWSTGHWSDQPELYLYNLETRQAVTVTVTPCEVPNAQPRQVGNLAISGHVVIFTCGQPMGYDFERKAFFSIPVYALRPTDGEWWGLEGWDIAGDRIVWVLSSERESLIYTAQIERRP